MEFRYLGFSHQGNARVYRFDVVAKGEINRHLTISADIGLFLAHHVGIQEGPTLCAQKLAADLEDKTEKSAVTPGPLAPARELLGDMLLQMNEPALAFEQFEATLKKEPGRLHALYGAARAAQLSGHHDVTQKYSSEISKVCTHADTPGRCGSEQATLQN